MLSPEREKGDPGLPPTHPPRSPLFHSLVQHEVEVESGPAGRLLFSESPRPREEEKKEQSAKQRGPAQPIHGAAADLRPRVFATKPQRKAPSAAERAEAEGREPPLATPSDDRG